MSPVPQAFVDRVKGHLAADEGKINYDQQLFTYLSYERFQRWVEVIGEHRPLAGVDAFSSGCGAGGSLVAYHEAGVATATGVEIDPVLAELGRLRVAGLDGVHALEYDGGRIPADDGRFDVVDSLDVLEHVGDADLYLRELIRVLRPGGCILLVTPNRVHPVEQHVRIVGPPWLPIRLANVAYYRAGEVIERRPAGADLGWRMRSVRAVRERNVGFVALRRLAPHRRARVWPAYPGATRTSTAMMRQPGGRSSARTAVSSPAAQAVRRAPASGNGPPLTRHAGTSTRPPSSRSGHGSRTTRLLGRARSRRMVSGSSPTRVCSSSASCPQTTRLTASSTAIQSEARAS